VGNRDVVHGYPPLPRNVAQERTDFFSKNGIQHRLKIFKKNSLLKEIRRIIRSPLTE